MRVFVISDTHFNHKKLIDWGRPEDFETRILKSLSQHKGDLLIHCGDFSIGNDIENMKLFMEASKGFKRKILIKGNHDNHSDNWYLERGFDFVCNVFYGEYFGKKIIFSHYPIYKDEINFSVYYPPDINIHGHLHGNGHRRNEFLQIDNSFNYDIAPDIHDYKVLNLEDLLTTPPVIK